MFSIPRFMRFVGAPGAAAKNVTVAPMYTVVAMSTTYVISHYLRRAVSWATGDGVPNKRVIVLMTMAGQLTATEAAAVYGGHACVFDRPLAGCARPQVPYRGASRAPQRVR